MRLIHLLLLFLVCPLFAYGQGSRKDDVATKNLVTGLAAAPGALITVCTSAGVGVPCTPLASIYSDVGLTSLATNGSAANAVSCSVGPTTNPCLADSNGNYGFYAAPGRYVVTVTGAGTTGKSVVYTLPCDPSAACTVSGTTTLCNLQGLIYVTGITGCLNTLAAAVAAASNGSYIILPPGSFTTTSTITISQQNLHILGSGQGTTFLAPNFATGNIFTLSADNFELGNMTVLPSVGRTSGWLLESLGHKFGSVHDLFIEDTYGGFHMAGIGGVGAGGWNFYRLRTQTSGGTHSGSFFSFGGGDGSPVADMWVEAIFSSGTSAIYDAPQILLDSGCDTNQFISYHAGYSTPNTSTQPVIQTQYTVTGGSNFAPRWIRFEQLSLEAGGVNGPQNVKIIAGNNIVINDSYLENAGQPSLEIVGGANTTGITVSNTVIAANQRGGIYVTTLGAPLGLDIHDNEFSCNSQFANNTYDNIQIAGGTTFTQIHDNQFGDGLVFGCGATLTRYGVNLLAGATDQYTIMGNQYSTLGTSAFLNAATGINFVWNDKQGGINLGNSATAPRLRFFAAATHYDWQISTQDNASECLEITPSTAVGGSTFSSPNMEVCNSPAAIKDFANHTIVGGAGLYEGEGAAPSGSAGNELSYGDNVTHTPSWNNNNNGTSSPTGAWQCTNVTPVTVNANVATDQNLMACTVPAGTLNRVGRTLRVKVAGIYTTPAASTAQMTVKVKLCTVSGCGSGTVISPLSIQSAALATAQVTNQNFSLRGELTSQTAGASSAYEAHGEYLIDLANLSTTAADSVFGDTNTATVGTIDSTAQLFLQVTFTFSAASASNSATQRQLIAETVN